jgi:hypothetical protein
MAIGLITLVFSIFVLAFGIQLFLHDKNEFAHNHAVTGSLKNAIAGNLDEKQIRSSEELSEGFTMDLRNRELVPCNQLTRESIKG